MNQRLLLLSACLIIAGSAAFSTSASAATRAKVGPHQYFDGLVNGSMGVGSPAIINVVCPGPSNQTGHPLAGQKVEVEESVAVLTNSGYTGDDATYIDAFFGPPPPTPATSGQVKFTKYGVAKAIPKSLELPCRGTGQVTFVPFPESPPTSQSASVAVEDENVAV
jgi:hypothetical protein